MAKAKYADPRPVPPCRPVLYATFRDQRLAEVEYRHQSQACALRECSGRVEHVPVAEWYAGLDGGRS